VSASPENRICKKFMLPLVRAGASSLRGTESATPEGDLRQLGRCGADQEQVPRSQRTPSLPSPCHPR
jgi:hypothetical protein